MDRSSLARRLDLVGLFAVDTPIKGDREFWVGPTPWPGCRKDGKGGSSGAISDVESGGGTGEADEDGGGDSCRGGEFERRHTDGTGDTGDSSKGKKLKRGTGRGWAGML